MKIQLNIEAFGSMPGTVLTVSPEKGERMVRNGDAVAVEEPKPARKTRTKPENKAMSAG